MLKEAIADYKRNQHDRAENGRLCTRLVLSEASGSSSFTEIESRTDEIKVGDIIRVKDGEILPADCILLASY